jgi:hypothetical protein
MIASSFQNLKTLDTSTGLESWASVSGRLVLLDELNVLEIVCPEIKGTRARRLPYVVVASILNCQPQVHVASKINTELHLGNVLNIDRVGSIAAQCTGTIGVVGRHTCATLE